MSEYIFVHLIDKQPVGAEFEAIPLHMTALHWFETDSSLPTIVRSTEDILGHFGKIVTYASIEDMFGPEKDIPVMRLEKKRNLVELHTELLQVAKNLGAVLDNRWVGADKWNPHVTHKKDRELHPGEKLVIDDIDLITRYGKDGNRKILHRFKLV